jgi:uncharacterized membrane protein
MVRCFEALTRDQVPRESLGNLLIGELPAAVTNGLLAALIVAAVGLWQGGIGLPSIAVVSVGAVVLAVAIHLPLLAVGIAIRRQRVGTGEGTVGE